LRLVVRITSYNLGPKLFLSHLVVALTGTFAFATAFAVAPLVAPASLADAGGETVAGQALLVHVLPAVTTATIAAVAASLFVARRISRPLRRIVEATRRLASGRYDERVVVVEDDEIGELAKSFNAMAEALEDGERRRRQFVADVSHELRTPLSTLSGYVDGLIDGVVKPGEEAWAPMHAEARRMRRLVDDLQQLARAETGRLMLDIAPFPPEGVAKLAVEGMRPLFAETTFHGVGFGLGFSVVVDPVANRVPSSPGEFAWGGAASTAFWVDPVERITVLFFTQLLPSSTHPIRPQLRQLVAQALVD
jgi:signal transduction histidine kinase